MNFDKLEQLQLKREMNRRVKKITQDVGVWPSIIGIVHTRKVAFKLFYSNNLTGPMNY